MTAFDELIAAISRAYALTRDVPAYHPSVRHELAPVGGHLRALGDVELAVEAGGLRMAGTEATGHGALHAAELSRDLAALGVLDLTLPGRSTPEDVQHFLAFVRERVTRARSDLAARTDELAGRVALTLEGGGGGSQPPTERPAAGEPPEGVEEEVVFEVEDATEVEDAIHVADDAAVEDVTEVEDAIQVEDAIDVADDTGVEDVTGVEEPVGAEDVLGVASATGVGDTLADALEDQAAQGMVEEPGLLEVTGDDGSMEPSEPEPEPAVATDDPALDPWTDDGLWADGPDVVGTRDAPPGDADAEGSVEPEGAAEEGPGDASSAGAAPEGAVAAQDVPEDDGVASPAPDEEGSLEQVPGPSSSTPRGGRLANTIRSLFSAAPAAPLTSPGPSVRKPATSDEAARSPVPDDPAGVEAWAGPDTAHDTRADPELPDGDVPTGDAPAATHHGPDSAPAIDVDETDPATAADEIDAAKIVDVDPVDRVEDDAAASAEHHTETAATGPVEGVDYGILDDDWTDEDREDLALAADPAGLGAEPFIIDYGEESGSPPPEGDAGDGPPDGGGTVDLGGAIRDAVDELRGVDAEEAAEHTADAAPPEADHPEAGAVEAGLEIEELLDMELTSIWDQPDPEELIPAQDLEFTIEQTFTETPSDDAASDESEAEPVAWDESVALPAAPDADVVTEPEPERRTTESAEDHESPPTDEPPPGPAGADEVEGAEEAPSAEASGSVGGTPAAGLGGELLRKVRSFVSGEGDGATLAEDIRWMIPGTPDAATVQEMSEAIELLVLHPVPARREEGARMAGELAIEPAVQELVNRLGSELDETRKAEMVDVLASLGERSADAIADALADDEHRGARRNYMDALIGMGPTGLDRMSEMADDPRWYVARNAVTMLGEVGSEEAVVHVTAALAHTDARVRREAVQALGRLGGEAASLLLVGMLGDPDAQVRASSARAVGLLEVERALRPLVDALESEGEDDVQVAMLWALGQLGDPGPVHLIEKKALGSFLSRPPRPVRIAAYQALSAIGTPHARTLLEQALKDRDGDVRDAVKGFLAESEAR